MLRRSCPRISRINTNKRGRGGSAFLLLVFIRVHSWRFVAKPLLRAPQTIAGQVDTRQQRNPPRHAPRRSAAEPGDAFSFVTPHPPCDIPSTMHPAPTSVIVSPDQPVPAEVDLLCQGCGYSLIGLMVGRCPACGASFDATALPLARVPWLYRKRLGRVSAYLQPLRFALFSPRRFATELCRPVRISEQDAHRFRMVTIAVASLGAALALAGFLQYVVGFWPPRLLSAGLLALCAGVWLMTFVFLRMATDLPTFIWRGLPGKSDDLSPLHEYAAAPLVLALPGAVVLVLLIFVLGGLLVQGEQLTVDGTLTLVGVGLVPLLWTWLAAMIFMRTATDCTPDRILVLGLYLPVHWAMMWLIVFLVVCAVAFYGAAVLKWLGF